MARTASSIATSLPPGAAVPAVIGKADISRARKDHIVRLYCEHYTCRQIADLTGLTYQYVRNSLKERGIKIGSSGGRYTFRRRAR